MSTPDPSLHVAVLADTHRRADRAEDLPDAVFDLVRDADVILHAGDIVEQEVLDVLARHAPVHAVLGNNDPSLAGVLPERLHGMFPEADLVVFGHSHIPWNETGVGGQLLFNPGSPTQRRRQPVATMGRLTLRDGVVEEANILPVVAS